MINNLPKTFCHPKNTRKIIPIFKREVKRGSLVKVKVAQSCLTLCDPMDYTVHGILQARILEWVAFPFSRGSSQPRDWTQVSSTAGRFFTSWATREAQGYWSGYPFPSPADLSNPGIEQGLLHCRQILYQLSNQGSSVGKESTCQYRRQRFHPWPGKITHALEQLSLWATTIEPGLLSLGATITEPMCCNCWSPSTLEPMLHNKRSHHSEKPVHLN